MEIGCFCDGGRVWPDVSVEMKLIWLSCGWSELMCFFKAGQKSPVFSSVSMRIDLHFVWVVKIDFISVCGIELDLIPV